MLTPKADQVLSGDANGNVNFDFSGKVENSGTEIEVWFCPGNSEATLEQVTCPVRVL